MMIAGATRADTVLWYNGDFNLFSATANELNTTVTDARVYDNFTVTAAHGWMIDRIWSNNLMNFGGVTLAEWTIRSGVSSGNGGSVVASGVGSAMQVATGRLFQDYSEYTIAIDGLNIKLGAGTYWLQVTPIGSGNGRSLNSSTLGLNAVGNPAGNDNNVFFTSNFFGPEFFLLLDSGNAQPTNDVSMGVAGMVNVSSVPELGSGTMALVGLSLVGMIGARGSAYRRSRVDARGTH